MMFNFFEGEVVGHSQSHCLDMRQSLFMLLFLCQKLEVFMIAYIEGDVMACATNHAVVKTGGLGYRVLMCKYDLAGLTVGQKIVFAAGSVPAATDRMRRVTVPG